MCTVSIIMPIYNTAEFLKESIPSALQQTYPHIELVLINDGSTDRSQEVINEFEARDARIRSYYYSERQGVGWARNKGIELATGKYIYFLDSDDYLAPETIEQLVEQIEDYDVVSGRQKRVSISHFSEELTEEQTQGVELFTMDKLYLIRNSSVLNRLFRRSYIIKHGFRFFEDVDRYTDLTFLIPVFLKTKTVPYVPQAVYYKRRRNDPFRNPALMQTGMRDRIFDLSVIYSYLKEMYAKEQQVMHFLDVRLLNIYRRAIVRHFRMNENVKPVFQYLVHMTRQIDPKILRHYPYFIRREIKVIQSGRLKRFKKVNLWHHRFRKLKTALRGKRQFYTFIYRALFLRLPVKDKKIVFESFEGKSYSDNPKHIYEYLLKRNPSYDYIWIVNQKEDIPGHPKQIKRLSLAYFYHLARAKYWVSNSRMPNYLNKREENTYLQTWHGTPLKRLAGDMEDVHMPGTNAAKYKRNFYNETRKWDYLISPNQYSTKIFSSAFWFEREKMLETGYPRNDLLYTQNHPVALQQLKKNMGLPENKKVILYAPTWRDNEYYEKGKYKFELQLNLQQMQRKFSTEYIILLRMHHVVASSLDLSAYRGFAYDFSHYPDIGELYLVSDLLITDYSSVFFDYANLKRPILFFTYDLETYRDTLRGFYIDIETEVPGPLLMTSEEVINAIQNLHHIEVQYKEQYERFYKRFCHLDDGKAAQRVVDLVFDGKS